MKKTAKPNTVVPQIPWHNDVVASFARDPKSGDLLTVACHDPDTRVFKAGLSNFYVTASGHWFYDANADCVVRLTMMSFHESDVEFFEESILEGYRSAYENKVDEYDVPPELEEARLGGHNSLSFSWGSYQEDGSITIKPNCQGPALKSVALIETYGYPRLLRAIKARSVAGDLKRRLSRGEPSWTVINDD